MILVQQPTATRVAGFRKWQELGRQVRRGEKAIRIFGFRTKKIDDEPADGATEAGERRTLTYYPMLSVFDIAQTNPVDPDAADPGLLARHLTGADEAGILDAVIDYLTAAGWIVERVPLPGGANGYTSTDGTRRVVTEVDLLGAQAAKTALHEAAHVLLHADDEPGEYAAHRGIKETEAESFAYVTAGLLGLDTAAYSVGYVAGWADGDAAVIRVAAAAVLRTVHISPTPSPARRPRSDRHRHDHRPHAGLLPLPPCRTDLHPDGGRGSVDAGAFVQDVPPEMPRPVREQLITGTHPACWTAAFGDDPADQQPHTCEE